MVYLCYQFAPVSFGCIHQTVTQNTVKTGAFYQMFVTFPCPTIVSSFFLFPQKAMYGANVVIFEGILSFCNKKLIDVSITPTLNNFN